MEEWSNLTSFGPQKFTCSFCGTVVGSDKGYTTKKYSRRIFICPNCNSPTYFKGEKQCPAPMLGNSVSDVPQEIESLYNEARACTGTQAHTAAVLACRKLLMHIAVKQGAQEGQSFMEYVEYLAAKGYVPPNGKIWVDHIRKKGNEANHEIALMMKEDAVDLITFIEMLLKFIYEFPHKIKSE
ncbi:MAG: DUF4145 domain-containing protein [candidate division Zixibacteria bacterium]|nr:DUF4145 domain-containing protein [candidate division Zixibacteria bacterium]